MYLNPTDVLKVRQTQGETVHVHVSHEDIASDGKDLPPRRGRTVTEIDDTTATEVAATPGSGFVRRVSSLTVKNSLGSNNATTAVIQLVTSGLTVDAFSAVLEIGESIHYSMENGYTVYDALGQVKTIPHTETTTAAPTTTGA